MLDVIYNNFVTIVLKAKTNKRDKAGRGSKIVTSFMNESLPDLKKRDDDVKLKI